MNQKKAKFNIVDLIVIVVLIAGVAFVALRMFGGGESPVSDDPASANTFHVTFYAESVPEEVAATLVQGSKAENASRNMDLGRLISFSTAESVYYGVNSDGVCVQSSQPGYVSVTMTFELTGVQQQTGLLVGQYMLNVGHSMGVRVGNTEINTYVQRIEPAAAQ